MKRLLPLLCLWSAACGEAGPAPSAAPQPPPGAAAPNRDERADAQAADASTPPQAVPPVSDAAAPGSAPDPADPAQVVRLDAPGRVVAIGDLHGDLAATRAALRLAGAIDEADRWVGGDLYVVQGGDQLDRGDDEPEILALLERLESEAAAAGGAMVVLNGNHELMNAAGDFRYVTEDGFADYGGPEGRRAAFAPGSPLANQLARRAIYAIVDDTVFTHAAISPEHAEAGLPRLDAEARAWLRGEQPGPPPVYRDSTGPLWSRRFAGPAEEIGEAECAAARAAMDRLGVKRMVIGHTVQPRVTSACDGRIWRVDVGLSRHYGGPVEVLEIEGGVARPLSASPTPR